MEIFTFSFAGPIYILLKARFGKLARVAALLAIVSCSHAEDASTQPRTDPPPQNANRFAPTDVSARLAKAAAEGDVTGVREWLRRGASVDVLDYRGWTPLIIAARAGSAAVVRELIEAGADVNYRTTNETGSSALCFAVKGGNLAVIQAFLDRGADINGASRNGMTPLIYAAAEMEPKHAQFLIERGAQLDLFSLRDGRGSTWSPLMTAANRTNLEMLTFLIDAGATIDATNNRGNTALMELSKRARPAALEILVDRGADVNATGPSGHTALIYAAYNGMIENLKLLLARGADPFATASDSPGTDAATGSSHRYGAADLALQRGHLEAYRLIKKAQLPPRRNNPLPKFDGKRGGII